MKNNIVQRLHNLEDTLGQSAIEYDGFWEALGLDRAGVLERQTQNPDIDVPMVILSALAMEDWADCCDDSEDSWYAHDE